MIRVTHSCGDCGYLTDDYEDFTRHNRRKFHREAVEFGLTDEQMAAAMKARGIQWPQREPR